MLATILHAKSDTGASASTGGSTVVQPADWNSAHLATFASEASDPLKAIAAGGATISSGTVVFATSNSVSFGMADGTVTASFGGGGGGAKGAILFAGSEQALPMGIALASLTTTASTSSLTMALMPATLGATQAIAGLFHTIGWSATEAGGGVTNAVSHSWGIFGVSGSSLTLEASGSIRLSRSLFLDAHSFTIGEGTSTFSYSTAAGSHSTLLRISQPLTLTLSQGTHYLGSLINGACSLLTYRPAELDDGGARTYPWLVLGESSTYGAAMPEGLATAGVAGAPPVMPTSIPLATASASPFLPLGVAT